MTLCGSHGGMHLRRWQCRGVEEDVDIAARRPPSIWVCYRCGRRCRSQMPGKREAAGDAASTLCEPSDAMQQMVERHLRAQLEPLGED
jgi:hypothetical protein